MPRHPVEYPDRMQGLAAIVAFIATASGGVSDRAIQPRSLETVCLWGGPRSFGPSMHGVPGAVEFQDTDLFFRPHEDRSRLLPALPGFGLKDRPATQGRHVQPKAR